MIQLDKDLAKLFEPHARTLPTLLGKQAARFRDRPLTKIGDLHLTYGEAPDHAARAAGALARVGIRRGDRVAVMCGNRPEFIALLLGCGWLGAILTPINTAARGAQLAHVLANSGARLLVGEAGLLPAFELVDFAALPVETIWLIGQCDEERVRAFASRIKPPGSARSSAVTPMPALAERVPAANCTPGDTFAILYTSGTTGVSKGVCCPHAQFFWWGVNTGQALELTADDVLHTTLPLFHTNAINTFFQALLHGAAVVYEPRFSVSGYWDMVANGGGTVLYLLGAMVPMLLARAPTPAERGHRARVALAAGIPASAQAEFIARTGIAVVDGYGSTETNLVIGATAARRRPGFMGPVFRGFEARVVDQDDKELRDGEPGELVLRAAEPYAFATGYFNMPDKTVEAWRNLWFHTGDRVVREPDGYLRFLDRLKDAIRRRGENISSYDVEQALLCHPDVANAAVFPVRSELAEDEVMAAIVRQPGSAVTELDLIRHCEPRLAYFAIPRFIEFVDDLPTTENGKVQKFKLRERGVTPRAWDRDKAGYKLRKT
jgi:carnitine-CoA ligase